MHVESVLCLQHASLFGSWDRLAILSYDRRAFCAEHFCEGASFEKSLCGALWDNLCLVQGDFCSEVSSKMHGTGIGTGETDPFVVEGANLGVALQTMQIYV